MRMMKIITIIVLLLKTSYCSAQSDRSFLIYNAQKNRCIGDDLLELDECDPHSVKQQFQWTSENRIFNVAQKKCLGTESKSEDSKLLWYICDASSDLQKWTCQSNLLFGLKNESLYLSTKGDSNLLTLSKDPGDKGKWRVHGTMDAICSRPYEELYTIQGNAFGSPCHFPFRFNNKWYTDCTNEGSSTNHLWANHTWCATESEYETNQLWGFCPKYQIVEHFWKKSPLTDVYYQVNDGSELTWYQARKSCQQQGGDLLSIIEPQDQVFISVLTKDTGPVLWMGLNSLDVSKGWHWIDGQPFRYLKWLSGQPTSLAEHSCGAISQNDDSEWTTAVCSERHGYICQRGSVTPIVPPVVNKGFCPSPGIKYSGHCYFLNRNRKTWLEARGVCRQDGGDLLSIHNIQEQSFVISQLGYSKTDELWIGFNDLKSEMLFEWSDQSSVLFAHWGVNEPSQNAALKEDCVIMSGEEGKWADQNCQSKYGYICKKKANADPSSNDTFVDNKGCKPGWIRYGTYCYLAASTTKIFQEAKESCEKMGSYLTDITNRVENAFLVSLVGAHPEKHIWIGLSNEKDKHTFEWTNTENVLFTHFNAGMPGGKRGCVAMTTGFFAGLWDVLNCSNKEKYICKQRAEGVMTTLPATVPSGPSCSQGWYPIKNREFCSKLFKVETAELKTWPEALDFCRELGGDLLSIHSDSDISQHKLTYLSETWIGYRIQDPSVGYVWSDGSSVSYENWENGQPDNLNNIENCAVLSVNFWSSPPAQWKDVHCEEKMNWFCEIQKGVTPKEVNIRSKTFNKTDDGWIIFKDSQYLTYDIKTSMKEAHKFCKQRHGDLVIINNEEERVFVWHLVKLMFSAVYIGIQIDLDNSLSWVDGSTVVFQMWEKNHPAFLNNEEHCAKMTRAQGLWESTNCGDEYKAICERTDAIPGTANPNPTNPTKGGCAPDWVQFQEKCYKIGLDLKTWTEAQLFCRQLRGELTSITNSQEQAFLTTKMDYDIPDLWIGLSSLGVGQFRWTDETTVGFTDWVPGDPAGEFMDPVCTVMGGMHRPQRGKWVSKNCNDKSGFICSRATDPQIIPSHTEEPNTFVKLGNSSYRVVFSNLTWKDAKENCEILESQLASIRDILTQSYVDLKTIKLGQPLWIGLNSMETNGIFRWIDNWPLEMEQWGWNEPKKDQPCVYTSIDGRWKTASCNQTFYSICKKSKDIAPTLPNEFSGVCPEQTDEEPKMVWLPYRGYCYAFVMQSASWNRASQHCKKRGSTLATISEPEDRKFIYQHLRLAWRNKSFWIGLFRNHREEWIWLDNTVVKYTYWAPSLRADFEFKDYDYEHYIEQTSHCAYISGSNGLWIKLNCDSEIPYICKRAAGDAKTHQT